MWNVLSGVSLGALTGLLLGLSASPVVGSVLGALIAGILVFLSLSNAADGAVGGDLNDTKLIRVSVFSMAATAAALLGIMIRSEQWLGASALQQQYSDLLSIGIPPRDAKAAILDRVKATPLDAEADRMRSPVLFAADVTTEQCQELDPDKFGSAQGAFTRYEAAGDPWRETAQQVEKLVPAADQMTVLKFVHQIHCAGKS